jgi:oxygen-independent coproporphyrinogen-3 oxidase
MFAIPGQTLELWEATIAEGLALQTEHLSCYEVIYEEDTPLFAQLQAGEFDIDEELAASMYDTLVERLAASGVHQYEVANFARHTPDTAHSSDIDPDRPIIPSKACRHNLGYWRGLDSFGLGPSASEYVDGVRSKNWSNTNLWTERLIRGHRAKEFAEALSPMARAGELAAFGLRMNAGWNFEEFKRTSGMDLRGEWKSDMEQMVTRGWGILTPTHFRLSRIGHRFADAAGAEFLRPEDTNSEGIKGLS